MLLSTLVYVVTIGLSNVGGYFAARAINSAITKKSSTPQKRRFGEVQEDMAGPPSPPSSHKRFRLPNYLEQAGHVDLFVRLEINLQTNLISLEKYHELKRFFTRLCELIQKQTPQNSHKGAIGVNNQKVQESIYALVKQVQSKKLPKTEEDKLTQDLALIRDFANSYDYNKHLG